MGAGIVTGQYGTFVPPSEKADFAKTVGPMPGMTKPRLFTGGGLNACK